MIPLEDRTIAESEWFWATPVGRNRYKIDNVPFFAYDLAVGDVVEALEKRGRLYVQKIVTRSGNATMRILLKDEVSPDDGSVAARLQQLVELGWRWENCGADRMLRAVDVPAGADLPMVQAILEEGSERGLWIHEEVCLPETTTAAGAAENSSIIASSRIS